MANIDIQAQYSIAYRLSVCTEPRSVPDPLLSFSYWNLEERTYVEENKEMERCSDSRSSTREMLKTSCTDLDSLPEELLIQILIRIPAQHIFYDAMFVCREWFRIIRTHNFRLSHLHNSASGFLIKHIDKDDYSFMSMTRAGQIEISDFSDTYNPRYHIWSSCNGLVLERDPRDKEYELMITNPVTKQHLSLPTFITRTTSPFLLSAITFLATRMEYKVVRSFYDRKAGLPSPRILCGVLTVGSADNLWRLVDTQHLSLEASKILTACPLVTGGFVHWAKDFSSNYLLTLSKKKGFITAPMRNNYILTMNMETEIITVCPTPQWSGGYYYHKYLSGGKYLSLMIGRGYLKWEVWEMEPETREWTRLPDIDLEAHKDFLNESYDREDHPIFKPDEGACLDCKLAPAGWLKYREVIIFAVYRPRRRGEFCQAQLRAAYNIRTQDIISVFEVEYSLIPYLAHTDSLMGIP